MLVLCYDKGSRSACPAMHLVYLHQPFPKITTPCSFPALPPQNPLQNKRFLTNTGSNGMQAGWLSLTTHGQTYLRLGDDGTSLLASRLLQKELHKPLVSLRCSDASQFLWQVSAQAVPSWSTRFALCHPAARWFLEVSGAAGSVTKVWVFLPSASVQARVAKLVLRMVYL